MRIKQKFILLCAMAAAGAVIGLLSALFGFSTATTDAVAGAALALFAAYGVPYAFGRGGRRRRGRLDRSQSEVGKAVEAVVPTVLTHHRYGGIAASNVPYEPVITNALYEDILGSEDPLQMPAGRARPPSVSGLQNSPEFVEVGHNGGNGSLSGDQPEQ